MRQFLPIALTLFFLASLNSQSQTIYYSYDAAGNRTSRTIVLGGGSKGSDDIKEEKKEPEKAIKDESFLSGSIKIYPNPTQGLLEIEVPVSDDNYELQIIVTDINGRKIIDKRNEPTKTVVDLSSQPGGMYILILKQGDTYSKWKIIKK
jgi:YD repeat-containing protein